MIKRLLIVAALSLSAVLGLAGSKVANAASFNAGEIISDSNFTDSNSMNTSQIQAFLNQRNSACLKNYSLNGESAAKLINDAAKTHGISPKVLLVTLQKEQGLILRSDCPQWRYNTAMGFGCPDSAACDTKWYGLKNQLQQGARHFRGFYNQSPGWYIPFTPGNRYIRYHPNGCSGSTVNIKNRATASLYSYTPYQPNAAAISAGYGTGNGCSSYGNRNFSLYYNSWFGPSSPGSNFSGMASARYMELSENLYKKDLYNNLSNTGSLLESGRKIYFTEKTTINGELYLRTRHDSVNGNEYAIPLSKLKEVTISYTPMESPRWMRALVDTRRVEPITQKSVGGAVSKDSKIFFDQKYIIDEVMYLRSASASAKNLTESIPLTALEDSSVVYASFETPRWMTPVKDTNTYDLRMYDILRSSNAQSSAKTAGSFYYFNNKTTINGKTFASIDLPAASTYTGTPLDELKDVSSSDFKELSSKRAYNITRRTAKVNLSTGKDTDEILEANTPVFFAELIVLGNKTYIRSDNDKSLGRIRGVKLSDATPIELQFQPMDSPRQFSTKFALQKQDPTNLRNVGEVLTKGRVISFSQKMVINGQLYLRTEHDSTHGHYSVIKFSSLQEL